MPHPHWTHTVTLTHPVIVEFSGLDVDATLVTDLDGVGGLVVLVHLGAGKRGGAVPARGHVARAVRRVHPVVAHGDVALAEEEKESRSRFAIVRAPS